MVFFICNHCGESLKKQVVDKHAYRCKRELNVSCMDCLKDFDGKTYELHTSCISEQQKYSDKNYVPKVMKGAKRQEDWIVTVRSIPGTRRDLPKGVRNVFEVIQRSDTIPRKMKGFLNFFHNSAKHVNRRDVEAAWSLIEEELKRNQQQDKSTNNAPQNGTNATSLSENGKDTPKRKHEPNPELQPTKQKKQKTKDTVDADGDQEEQPNGTTNAAEKFRWSEIIRNVLSTKNNQMKLSKLKKKVMKSYRQFADGEPQVSDEKFEKKFNKKLSKAEYVVENDTVRLVA